MRPEDLLARLEAGYEYDPMYGRLCNERDQLKAENDKLRRFARDMWCMTTFCHGTSDAEIADMYRRMRELGFMENYG